VATPPEHLSPSGWSLWQQCPRAWAAKYVDGIDPPVGWQAEVGTFAHEVLDRMMQRSRSYRTIPGARTLARKAWGTTPTKSIARGEITEAEFKRRAWHAITGLWGLEEPAEVDVVATEREFNWREGDVPMKVIVDRIDRHGRDSLTPGLSVVDYKTGRLPKKKYSGPHKRQVTIGAMAVASQEGPLALAEAGVLLYLSADTSEGAPTGREARRAVSEQAHETWAEITGACANETFEPRTGPLCAWCPIVADCPEGRSHVRWRLSRGYVTEDAPGAKLVAALDAA
jgi:putative RecB family exonuclease